MNQLDGIENYLMLSFGQTNNIIITRYALY